MPAIGLLKHRMHSRNPHRSMSDAYTANRFQPECALNPTKTKGVTPDSSPKPYRSMSDTYTANRC